MGKVVRFKKKKGEENEEIVSRVITAVGVMKIELDSVNEQLTVSKANTRKMFEAFKIALLWATKGEGSEEKADGLEVALKLVGEVGVSEEDAENEGKKK